MDGWMDGWMDEWTAGWKMVEISPKHMLRTERAAPLRSAGILERPKKGAACKAMGPQVRVSQGVHL